jgi:mannosyltransferase
MVYRHTVKWVVLLCLLLIGYSVRVISLDGQSMWRDEIDTMCFSLGFWEKLGEAAPSTLGAVLADPPKDSSAVPAGSPDTALYHPSCQPTPGLSRIDASRGVWPTLRGLLVLEGWNGPLYTLVMRLWIALTGYGPFALRYSSLLFGLLAIPLTFVMGRRLAGQAVGLAATALVALSPHLVWYSQEAKMYALVLFLSLLALYSFRRALDTSARWWAVMVAATTAALYCHVLAALLIPLYLLLGLVWWPKTRRRWRGALASLACLTLPYAPLLVWQARDWLLPPGQATLFAGQGLGTMIESTLEAWAGNFLQEPWATLILAALAVLVLFGVTATWWSTAGDQRSWRRAAALFVWSLVPLLSIWLISIRQPIFTTRYLIWAAPAFYMLAGVGFAAMLRHAFALRLGAVILLLAVLLGDAWGLAYQATQPIKPDFKSAAAYLEGRYQTGDLIVFHLAYVTDNFDYYFGPTYNGWGAPAPGDLMSEDDVDAQMKRHTAEHQTVWLVLSEAAMWDPRGLIKSWLDGHTVTPPDEQAFAHVNVYRYQLGVN